MIILQANKIERSFAGEVLFEHINLQVDERDRIALVGKNVAGKSTLLKILVGEEEPTSGEINKKKDISLSYLAQDSRFEHLLVGGGQQVVPVLAVAELEQGGAVVVPAPGGLIGLGRQEGREVDLLAAHGVHLLAHDVLDLAQRPQPQRQPGVHPGGGPKIGRAHV